MRKHSHKPVAREDVSGRRAVLRLFAGVRTAATVSDLMATLAAGQTVSAECVPAELLPVVLLLHAVAPEPGIVDSIETLVDAIAQEYNSKEHGPRFWHPEGFLVSALVSGSTDTEALAYVPEAGYLYKAYEELTGEQAWTRMFGNVVRPRKESKRAGR